MRLKLGAAVFVSAVILLCAIMQVSPTLAAPAAKNSSSLPAPEKLQQLQRLLDDPGIKHWISTAQAGAPAQNASSQSMSVLSARVAALRGHLRELVYSARKLPSEISQAPTRLASEAAMFGVGRALLLVALICAVAFGARWGVIHASRRTVGGDRKLNGVTAIWASLAFAAGGILPLLLFDCPPILQKVMIGFLLALSGIWMALALARLLVGPAFGTEPAGAIGLPLLDVSAVSGAFWSRRCVLLVAYFLIGWAVVSVMPAFGFSAGSRALVAYLLGLGLLVIAVEAVWDRPAMRNPQSRNVGRATLLTVFFVILWGLWVAGLETILWLGIYAVVLAPVLNVVGSATKAAAQRHPAQKRYSLLPVLAERAARALVVVLALVWLAVMFGIGTQSLMGSDTVLSRIVRGVLSGIAILLVADLIWQIAKNTIDLKLQQAREEVGGTDEEVAKRAKLRTLLPIFRNMLAAFLGIVAVLMVLASLGVKVAPLIAGAGVFGVAVGFGSQTLVKDVISGMFYLWDDAFRLGEYIQSGKYMGTVESFSLRSVRLRHHRGPVFTVPFGELGAVENMSRDWVIDKMTLNVTYDTDIAKAKKVIKQIGQKLQEDPDFAPYIIETLKMKGVDKFAEFSMQISVAMKTKPGQQFVIRRRANAMIREAFKENGIEFAFPTVQIAGDDDPTQQAAAAAHNVVKAAGNKASA